MSPLFNSGLHNSLRLKYSRKPNANPLIGVFIIFSAILIVQCREQNINSQVKIFLTTNTYVDSFLQHSNGREIQVSPIGEQNIDHIVSYLRSSSDSSEAHFSELIQGLVKGHENQGDNMNTFLLNNKETKVLQYESKTADNLYKQLEISNSTFKFNDFVSSLSKTGALRGDSKWLVIFISHEHVINSLILISVDAINKNLGPEAQLSNNSDKKAETLKAISSHRLIPDLVVTEGSMGGLLLLALVIGVMVFGGIAVYKYIKKKKQRLNAEQAKIEKLKFIPRIASTSNDTVFNESINGLKSIFPSKKSKKKDKDGGPDSSTPTYKLPQTLKLEEDTHQPSVINDNIFTNIENSPNSSAENSPRDGAKETPRGINFDIEFSILENDKKDKK